MLLQGGETLESVVIEAGENAVPQVSRYTATSPKSSEETTTTTKVMHKSPQSSKFLVF